MSFHIFYDLPLQPFQRVKPSIQAFDSAHIFSVFKLHLLLQDKQRHLFIAFQVSVPVLTVLVPTLTPKKRSLRRVKMK